MTPFERLIRGLDAGQITICELQARVLFLMRYRMWADYKETA